MQIIKSYMLIALMLMSCESERKNLRDTRPTDDGENNPGFLDTIEQSVSPSEPTEVKIGNSTWKLPQGSLQSGQVRLSRSDTTPEMTDLESSLLSDALSDILTIEVYDDTKKHLGSGDLAIPYDLQQAFTGSGSNSSVGMYVITDPRTPNEMRGLIPNEELSIAGGASLLLAGKSEFTAKIQLKLTYAVVFLVTYTEPALTKLNVIKANSAESKGGSQAETVVISQTSQSMSSAAVEIDNGNSYTNSTTVQLQLSGDDADEMYVTGEAGCTSGGNWESFSPTKEWTLSTTNVVSRVYARFRSGESVSRCMSDSITHDNLAPAAPSGVSDGETSASLTSTPTLSWSASTDDGAGVSYYELAIGSSAGASDVKNWHNVGNLTSIVVSALSLTQSSQYYASVRAVDLAGNRGQYTSSNGWTVSSAANLTCPTNYIKVPADSALDVAEFCVMKYEAKIKNEDAGHTTYDEQMEADSRPGGTPWVEISRNQARSECSAIGLGYSLITNSQWQSIARNIESAQSPAGFYLNWSNNSIADQESINRGNSDNTAGKLDVTDTNDPCNGTGNNSCTDYSDTDFTQKRTHTFSNGSIIWDFAGNVWEHVYDDVISIYGLPTEMKISEVDASFGDACLLPGCSGPQGKPKAAFGPAGDFHLKNMGEYGGLGKAFTTDPPGGALIRGGHFYDLTDSGIFAVSNWGSSNYADPSVGFRCVYNGG